MKKILITGVNSYIGNSLKKWLSKYPDKYSMDSVTLRCESWKEKDFSSYDVVFHVAGIAHVSSDPMMEAMYYKINCDLTVEVAKKAQTEGVKQFIFMSSIIVYGDSSKDRKIINRNTAPTPSNFYGNSKLLAEEGIRRLSSNEFKVVIVRPPMIYGKGSKGNYPKLARAAKLLPVFPNVENERSILHIDNLCEFLRHMIDNQESGIFFPQNSEYMRTSEMVRIIAKIHGKRILLTKLFNPILKMIGRRINLVNKVFGNLVYSKDMSEYKDYYQIWDLQESIKITELGNENEEGSNCKLL